MSMVTITCPQCSVDGKMSLLDNRYNGPYRCWKCHTALLLVMDNAEVISCTPMSEEEFTHHMELKKQRDRMNRD
ncbi:MAG: hypothetical protein FWF18_02745 [Dehalococcoidia bacterium]|nr:hypothetical protein [Dehalococcoidia bacterium]